MPPRLERPSIAGIVKHCQFGAASLKELHGFRFVSSLFDDAMASGHQDVSDDGTHELVVVDYQKYGPSTPCSSAPRAVPAGT
jgi:hypothetical protein